MILSPPPTNNSVDSQGKDPTTQKWTLNLSFIWMQWFSRLFAYLQSNIIDFSNASIQAPTTGFLILISDRMLVLTLNPVGTLAAGTLKTPANPYDGQPLDVSTTHTITALTFSASGTQTVMNAPTTLLAGTGFGYYYNLGLKTWFRRY